MTWMGTNSTYFKYNDMFKKAIKDASDSKNSDAIFIIMSILFKNKMDIQKIFELIYQDKILKNHFIRYLRTFKPNILKSFSDYFCLSDIESGYIFYKKAFANDSNDIQLEFVRLALKFAKQNKIEQHNEIVVQALEEQFEFMTKYDVDVLTTVNEKLEDFYEKNQIEQANKYIQEQKYSFKILLRLKEYERADQFIEINHLQTYDFQQKKRIYNLDPELVADQFYKVKEYERAWKYIQKIEDVVVACDRLVGLDQIDKAIDHAIQCKNMEALERVRARAKDQDKLIKINQAMLSLGQSMDEQKRKKTK